MNLGLPPARLKENGAIMPPLANQVMGGRPSPQLTHDRTKIAPIASNFPQFRWSFERQCLRKRQVKVVARVKAIIEHSDAFAIVPCLSILALGLGLTLAWVVFLAWLTLRAFW